MKKSVRTLLTALLVLASLFSMFQFLKQQRDKAAGSSIYADALALASSGKSEKPTVPAAAVPENSPAEPQWVPASLEEEDPHIRLLADLDLESLREVNPDVMGWILIPDTEVNYPIMAGTEDNYYLNHTWDRKSYGVGSIFLEHLCRPDFTDFNTIVYGHNMNDGSMFGSLLQYRQEDYRQAHPYVYIRSDLGVYRYEIFSSYFAKVDSNTYGVQFTSENQKIRFLDHILGESEFHSEIQPETTDRILTLSTCSGRGYSNRWVVHARLKMVLPTP